MELNFEKICRICLNLCGESVKNIFEQTFTDSQMSLANFLSNLTQLKFSVSDSLPKNICNKCTVIVTNSYDFSQSCIKTESLIRTEETRRMLRKIEQEALSEEQVKEEDCFDQYDESSDSCSDQSNIIEQIVVTIKPENNKVCDKYACKFCSQIFNNKTKLAKHEKTHDDSKPYKCEHCSQTFSKQTHLNVHLRSHIKDEDKLFACKFCNKQFTFKYLLTQHEYKHTNEKPFPCPKCDKGCLTAESLRRHMKIHDPGYIKKVHLCVICNKVFPYPSYLVEHMRSHTDERPHLCSVCGKGFRHTGALHFHQRRHTGLKPFTCTVCNEQFMSKSNLNVHMRKHTNERPYVCDVCGASFRQVTDLKSHQRTHTGEKRVLCTICGKKFTTTGQLTVHIRSHTGEKPFACSVCQKAFTTKTLLTKHVRIHTGERPYTCTTCNKSFTQSSTLKTHQKTHAKVKPLKRRRCRESSGDPVKSEEMCDESTEKKYEVCDSNNTEEMKQELAVTLPSPVPILVPT